MFVHLSTDHTNYTVDPELEGASLWPWESPVLEKMAAHTDEHRTWANAPAKE